MKTELDETTLNFLSAIEPIFVHMYIYIYVHFFLSFGFRVGRQQE